MENAPQVAEPRVFGLEGHAREFFRDELGFLERTARLGDVVRLRFYHKRVWLLSHPSLIESIFGLRGSLRKPLSMRTPIQRRLFGAGPLTADGEPWRAQRAHAQPALERLGHTAPVIAAATERQLASWRDDEVRDVHAALQELALRVVAGALLGLERDVDLEVVRALTVEVRALHAERSRSRVAWGLDSFLPTIRHRSLVARIDRLDQLVNERVEASRRGSPTTDVLARLVAQPSSPGQLRDQIVTLLLAGFETVALAVGWALELLARHPTEQRSLQAESDRVLSTSAPSDEQVASLDLTRRVLSEALRLYPPNRSTARETTDDLAVGGLRFRRGDQLLLSQWIVHRDGRFFADPLRFDPARWTADRARALPRYAFFPFGGGARACPGRSFAIREATLILAMIARRFSVAPVAGRPAKPEPRILLYPASGIWLRLSKR
ncbi:MAG: cytochrome [Myxococcales bacterium]|nr:cytochrome [Myxococcales bacterium]